MSAGIISATMLAFAGPALPVQADDLVLNGSFIAVINHDGQCLDMRSPQPDAQAQVEPCSGQSEQRWAWRQVSGGDYLLQNGRWGLCLTILNHYNQAGGKVVPTACTASDTWEHWDPTFPTADGVQIADAADHGFVMHPAVCTTAIGAEIYMNAPNQCLVDFWHG